MRTARNKRGSLEIGVNTIVILVIAMMLLGLGIGFVKGLFGKINKLPDTIPIETIGKEPTSHEPFVVGQPEIVVKAGKNFEQIKAGIYNKWPTKNYFTVRLTSCTGGLTASKLPYLDVDELKIEPGTPKGIPMNIYGYNQASPPVNLEPGKVYICTLTAYGSAVAFGANTPTPSDEVDSIQFTLKVTS